MQPTGPEAPIVLVKWYDYSKWLLERVENFPKSQRFVLGQRLAGQAMDVMDLLVEGSMVVANFGRRPLHYYL